MRGLLCEARKLAPVACPRRDPLAPGLPGITRIASQSVPARFFQGFSSAGGNLRCFRPLWRWSLDRLPGAKDGCTPWIWIPPGCRTRTAVRKARGAAMPDTRGVWC